MNDPANPTDPKTSSSPPGPGQTPPPENATHAEPTRAKSRKRSRRKAHGKRTSSAGGSSTSRLSWAQIKKLVEERLRKLDRPKLEQMLIAAGIATAAALAIVALCKHVPLASAILVLLGLGLLLRFWQEIRRLLWGD